MIELVTTSAFRNSRRNIRDDEGVSVLEEDEELIDGLSQFPSGLISINLQSSINGMVGYFSLLIPLFFIHVFS